MARDGWNIFFIIDGVTFGKVTLCSGRSTFLGQKNYFYSHSLAHFHLTVTWRFMGFQKITFSRISSGFREEGTLALCWWMQKTGRKCVALCTGNKKHTEINRLVNLAALSRTDCDEKQPRKRPIQFWNLPRAVSESFWMMFPNHFGTIVREPHVVVFSELVLSKHGCQTKHNQTC